MHCSLVQFPQDAAGHNYANQEPGLTQACGIGACFICIRTALSWAAPFEAVNPSMMQSV
jgi:hypothetical protein